MLYKVCKQQLPLHISTVANQQSVESTNKLVPIVRLGTVVDRLTTGQYKLIVHQSNKKLL